MDIFRNTDTRDDLSKYFYRKSVNQQHNINFSGGSEKQQYFFSAGYDKNLQSIKENDFNRITLNANNTYSLFNNRLEFTSGISFSKNNTQSNGIGKVNAPYPYLKLVDGNGKGVSVPSVYRTPYLESLANTKLLDWYYRPFDEISATDNTDQLTDYRINGGLNFKIINGLILKGNYQYNRGIYEFRTLSGVASYNSRDLINKYSQILPNGEVTRAIPFGGILDKRNAFFDSQNLRGLLSYDRNWNGKHQLATVAGAEVNKRDSHREENRQYGYNEDMETGTMVNYFADYPTLPLSALNKIPNQYPNPTYSSYDRNVSYFANAAYSYLNRYMISGSARKDESNLFGVKTNMRGVPLWSAGVSWTISKEEFYKIPALTYLKVRLTTGYNGNVNKSLSAVTTLANNYLNVYNNPAILVSNPPNPSLRWERIQNFNAGLDFGFKNERITGSIEYYKKKSKDLIGTSPIDPSTGFTTFTGNTANTEGEGIDIIINSINTTSSIGWSTTFLFSQAKDKVTQYNLKINGLTSILGEGLLNPVIGNAIIGMYSYKWAGLDPSNGDPQGLLNGLVSKDYSGFSTSTDINNLRYHGSRRPTIYGAMRNSFSWKEFELSFNIKYSFNYFFRTPAIGYSRILFGNSDGGSDEMYNNRWKVPGDELNTNIPSLVSPNSTNASIRDQFYQYSEITVEKGDHIRLQDIQFSYKIPNIKRGSLAINNISFYGYINNLGILWKASKSDFDPDYSIGFPLQRTYAIGIRADF